LVVDLEIDIHLMDSYDFVVLLLEEGIGLLVGYQSSLQAVDVGLLVEL
jgi:hypothetical protein